MIVEYAKSLEQSFRDYIFTDEGHKYTCLADNRNLISVTTRIATYQEKFNTKFWTMYKAFQRSGYHVKFPKHYKGFYVDGVYHKLSELPGKYDLTVSPVEVRKEWDYLSDEGKDKGSRLHDYLQNGVYRRLVNNGLNKKLKHLADKFLYEQYFKGPYEIVAVEVVMSNGIIAGQADNLSDLAGRKILRDYKTDKKIRFSNRWQNFKEPFSHLDDCEFNKYSLQLSTYRYILEKFGHQIDACEIIWFNKDNDDYVIYETPYLKEEAKIICNDNW